jgi:hypothetical protein
VTIPTGTKHFIIAWTVFHAFQFFIPVALLVAGVLIWWKRKKA